MPPPRQRRRPCWPSSARVVPVRAPAGATRCHTHPTSYPRAQGTLMPTPPCMLAGAPLPTWAAAITPGPARRRRSHDAAAMRALALTRDPPCVPLYRSRLHWGCCREEHAARCPRRPHRGPPRRGPDRNRRPPDSPRPAAAAVWLRAAGRHLPGCARFTSVSLPGSQRRSCAVHRRAVTAKVQHTLKFIPSRRDAPAESMSILKVGGQLRSSTACIS